MMLLMMTLLFLESLDLIFLFIYCSTMFTKNFRNIALMRQWNLMAISSSCYFNDVFQQYDIDTQNLIVNVQLLNVKVHEISSISKNDSCYYFHTNGNFCSLFKDEKKSWKIYVMREAYDLGSCRTCFGDVYTTAIIGMIIACFNFLLFCCIRQ